MQDKAIQARTQLRLGTELNQQKQKLQDFKLNKQQARIEQSRHASRFDGSHSHIYQSFADWKVEKKS